MEAFAKRFLGNGEETEENDSNMAAKDKVERLEKTNQGITAINSIMYHSLGLYEEAENMTNVRKWEKIWQMLEGEKKYDKC